MLPSNVCNRYTHAHRITSRLQDFHLAVDIDALIDHVDKDGSGEIEFQEFLELMRKDKPS